MRRRFLGPVCVLLLCLPAQARQLANPNAREPGLIGPAPAVVQIGSASRIDVRVEGGDAELFELPQIDGLEWLERVATIRGYQTLVDGRPVRLTETSWQLSVTPARSGLFQIPALRVRSHHRDRFTRELRLEALPSEPADALGFVRLIVPRSTYHLHQRIPVRVRFGLEERFLREQVIALFGQRLDVAVQLLWPGSGELSGAIGLTAAGPPPPADPTTSESFALGDEVGRASRVGRQEEAGKRWIVYEIERTFLPDRSGPLTLPAPVLRFAFATRFEDDLFRGRLPADRQDGFVVGEPLELEILELPEAGLPAGYRGAVGRFEVDAVADRDELAVGETVRLTLRIRGTGNLSVLSAPGPGRIPGFHLFGRIDSGTQNERTVRYDLTPLNEKIVALPALAFDFFDPEAPAGYRTIATSPIPLEVGPGSLPAGVGSAAVTAAGGRDPSVGATGRVPAVEPGSADEESWKRLLPVRVGSPRGRVSDVTGALPWVALLLPWSLAGWLLVRLGRRDRERADPDGVRARNAAVAFRSGAGRFDIDLSETLASYLAARMRLPVAAVIEDGLSRRLEEHGVRLELAERTEELLARLVAARYGGPTVRGGAALALDLVSELERAFLAGERRR